MVGGQEVGSRQLHKQALILESDLNRLALQAEYQSLRDATVRVSQVTQAWRRLAPWVLLLAPVAGFLTIRSVRQPGSVIGRIGSALKWAQPLYSLWRGYRARE